MNSDESVGIANEPDVSSIVFVCITSILFYYAPKIVSTVKAKAMALAPSKPVDPRVIALISQIREHEDELNKISPTSHFSAYFKKERQLNKLKDDLETLYSTLPKDDNSKERMKIDIIVRLFFNFIGFFLLYLSAGIHAFCMDSRIFWPLNHFLRFPSIFSQGDVCGGTGKNFFS